MKKYIIYIAVLAVGLLLGWMFFGGNTTSTETVHKHNEATETNQMWTCSMHPQIMQPEAGDCPICGMDLIPAASSAKGLLADQFKLSKNAMALANIQTSIVGESISNENSGFVLSGKITENEDETATMPAHFNGRVEKLFVNSLGERVEKGQTVAQIYSPALIAAQQELITAYKLKASQPQLYNAVKNKFKNWMIHGKQLEEVEQTGQVKNSFTIYSHVSGVVTEIAINVGSHIMDGKPIFKVSNLNTVWANFDVYENQISQFKKGQDIVVTTKAYSNKEFKGKVDFIDPILDSKTRTVKLRVVLNNKNELFKPGMFVEGRINGVSSSSKAPVLLIPDSAVLWTGKRSVVYIKTNPNEPVFQMQDITLGHQFGDNYQVLEGLNNGDVIVTNGTFTVDAAAQLQGKKSMMNKKGGKVMTGHEGHLGMEMTPSVKTEPLDKNTRIKVPEEFQNQLKVVFNDYIILKNALVKDDLNSSKAESKQVLNDLNKVDKTLLKNKEIYKHWVSIEKEIKTVATSISNTYTIEEQRKYFKNLSSHLTEAVEVFGINEKVYRQFCPMGDNNKGAYWLSKEEKIINPYFGSKMLTCGEVKQIID
ncbi:efflux RND transporter periplasmic adaptor subunit [Algibacter sp. L4_22]|uniref:efflux RND transporter periplasmic adaptor subunit n=1 Tax=Algibacter sp. L4_22 TaxID=2942477 RepID=UPI00201B8A12|nr:efflux RND transporter periplasmic adaptor subunit [Algibacter sp. L4_22]MCL5130344.1 efflux RND transporter periplasmic adaptor subunit [Algibacter sp. L4_22]